MEDMIYPFPQMSSDEQETLKGVFSSLESWLKPKANEFREWDRKGEMPPSFLQEMREVGLFGLILPEGFGGLNLSSTGYSRALQELAKYDGSVAITVGAHSSIGMRGLVLFGTPEQKQKYSSRLATGEWIAAFCLTEPGAGSDAASIQTRAVRSGDDWILSGQKIWITNGGIADFFTVFARTDTPEGQITAFIVTKDMPGVSCGPHEDKMGLRASSTTTVHFDQVRVPSQNVLGKVGEGFKVAMKILNSGRSGLGGGCVGGMKRLIGLATRQANERVQFGKKIAEFGLVKQKIGHMMVDCYATESVVALVAGMVDQGYEDYAVEAAISKVFGTECLWRVADDALQIAAGNGFMCEFPYERILRDSRVNRIFEGTNDILRLFIALTAMNDVGKQLKDLSDSLEGIFHDPIKGFGVLSEYGIKKLAQATKVVGPSFSKIHPRLKPQVTVFENAVRDLSFAADRILRKHGKQIIHKQFATQRLANIMIDLFVLSSVLSRVSTSLEASSKTEYIDQEVEILSALTSQVQRRVKLNFDKIDDNDDEWIKSLADFAFRLENYPWDNVK